MKVRISNLVIDILWDVMLAITVDNLADAEALTAIEKEEDEEVLS